MNSYTTPLTVTLTHQLQMDSINSIDEATALDISESEYADLINFEAILNAAPTEYDDVHIIKNSMFLDIARKLKQNDTIGILLLYLFANNNIIIIVDDQRELIINKI